MREELKSYVHKHNLLAELGEAAKDLLQSYNILEDLEQLELSENTSQLQEEGSCASTKDVRSSAASSGAGNLKPKSLISNGLTVAKSNNKDTAEKRVSVANDRASNIKNLRTPVSVKDANVNNAQKRSQKPRKVESNVGNATVKTSIKDSIRKEADPVPTEDASFEDKDIVEDKENMDSQSMDGAMLKEEIQTS